MSGESLGYDIAEPDPAALIESLRAFGYSAETAVADLIDNSITADSKNVELTFDWDGSATRVTISDDGRGMAEGVLVKAMRPGSTSPLQHRAPADLGRFGLGLKTASFSQCRRLTVVSKKASAPISARRWDLDVVAATGEWRLLRPEAGSLGEIIDPIVSRGHGTVVIWEHLDRIVGDADVDDAGAHMRFLQLVRSVKDHIGMTFHRFLSGRGAIRMSVNGGPVEPWDPFLEGHPARQGLGRETFPLLGGDIVVRPFVLPHRSKLSPEEMERAGGTRGWNSLQGFYVYRNRRLLVAGDWLGLGFTKEEHYKLARIQVDITNAMDALWHIDVRKSVARPPGELRDQFRRIARVTRQRAVEVFRHRGRLITQRESKGIVPVWQQKLSHGKTSYEINRAHPMVGAVLEAPDRKGVGALLLLIQETVPIPLIMIAAAERPEEHAGPFERADPASLRSVLELLWQAFRRDGLSPEDTKQRLLSTDPFPQFSELVEAYAEEVGP